MALSRIRSLLFVLSFCCVSLCCFASFASATSLAAYEDVGGLRGARLAGVQLNSELNLIDGEEVEGGLHLFPSNPLTKGELEVMLDRWNRTEWFPQSEAYGLGRRYDDAKSPTSLGAADSGQLVDERVFTDAWQRFARSDGDAAAAARALWNFNIDAETGCLSMVSGKRDHRPLYACEANQQRERAEAPFNPITRSDALATVVLWAARTK